MNQSLSAIDALKQHVLTTTYQDLPATTVQAAKTFILDSVGVGISGSRVSRVEQVLKAAHSWGQGQHAQVWGTGQWLPASSAALINGYQIHNQEWDCVHEDAVVHPMATILSALVAVAQQYQLSGKQLILGVTLAVDVATLIGQSVTSELRFFRPSICGCLGATAGICAMLEVDEQTLSNALGIAYSKLSGTMQAHVEGSPMLAMQIGVNAQSAVQSVDLARAGFEGPKDILQGPYGYFNLFESRSDLARFWQQLGKSFQIERISHKPFPTGRAGHGTVEGLQELMKIHGFKACDVDSIEISAPPLIHRLVGRPAGKNMDSNYAKLCNGYIAATTLLAGTVSTDDFDPDKLTDAKRLILAKKVVTKITKVSDSNTLDPNALSPVRVSIILTSGEKYQVELTAVLGHPDRPLSKKAQLDKFFSACKSAKVAFSDQAIDELINRIDALEQISNINDLVELMIIK